MGSKKENVVIVEDSKFYRVYLEKFCIQHKLNPITYISGDELIKDLDSIEADIFLVDIEMPGINGFQTCKKIKSIERLKDVPVLFLSSNVSEEYISKGFLYGGNDYITKPVNDIVLISRINNQLSQLRTKILLKDYINELLSLNKKLKQEEERATRLAEYDFLTNIYNRRKFTTEFKKASKSGKNINIALIDIDNFKGINDTYGHNVGDEVLVKTTQEITKIIESFGTLGRWGGEEFIIFFTGLEIISTKELCEEIRRHIASTIFSADNKKFKVTVTIGLVEFKPELGYDKVFNKVDEALYKGKTSGKNKVVYIE